MANKSG